MGCVTEMRDMGCIPGVEDMMESDKKLAQEAQNLFDARIPFMGKETNRILETVEQCQGLEQTFLKFLYGTLPVQDIGDCDVTVLRSYCAHACRLLKEMPWCGGIPESIFVHYVLYPRINSEFIEDCRPFFYEQLKERVKGMTMEQAVLEVNYWCAECASYESTDDRTASPLTVYRCGRGRCGEESTFAVTALRSVGIPARQVYVPKWSHCDDNHAWVEAWVDGKWHFLGACEPEEVLDKGWFTHASSRAVLVHSRTFSDFGRELGKESPENRMNCTEEFIGGDGPVRFENETKAYALTKRVKICVTDQNHVPAKGAAVSVEILNMAQYCPVLTMETDENGCVEMDLGMGSVHLWAEKDGKQAQRWIMVGEDDETQERVQKKTGEKTKGELHGSDVQKVCLALDSWADEMCRRRKITVEQHHVKAPSDYPMHPVKLTREQKERNRKRLSEADRMRQNRQDDFFQEEKAAAFPQEREILREAGGNFEELYQFLTVDEDPARKTLLHCLTKKDWKDAKAWILEDHLQEAKKEIAGKWSETCISYVLCPRIELEQMTPYWSFIKKWFDEETLESFRRDPRKVWKEIGRTVSDSPQLDDGELVSTPVGCLKLGQGNERSRKILFVAICRTLGIPARIHEINREAEYFDGTWHQVSREPDRKMGSSSGEGVLVLRGRERNSWKYGENWSLGAWDGRRFQTLNCAGIHVPAADEGDGGLWGLRMLLAPGLYRLITASRMPNGNQNAMEWRFCIEPGKETEVSMTLAEGNLGDMLMANPLSDLEVQGLDGRTVSMAEVTKGRDSVWAFLEEGKEPTEHVLNEILEQEEVIKQEQIPILFLIRGKEALENRTVEKVLKTLPDIQVYIADFESQVEPLARRMYVDPEKLPLLIAVRDGMTGIYGCSGYHVGSVGLIWKLMRRKMG